MAVNEDDFWGLVSRVTDIESEIPDRDMIAELARRLHECLRITFQALEQQCDVDLPAALNDEMERIQAIASLLI